MTADNRAASAIRLTTFDESAIRAAAEDCRGRCGGRTTLAVAFVSPDWGDSLRDFIELVQIHAHAPMVVGCSADGIIGVGEEDEGVSGFSLLCLNLPNTKVEPVALEADGRAAADRLRRAGISQEALEGFVAIGNPVELVAEDWLRDWNTTFPGAPIFGGLASGGRSAEKIFTFDQSGRHWDSAGLALAFAGGIRLEGVVSQGCRPIGEAYPITEVDDNIIVSIGQRRAYEVLEEAFESLPEEEQSAAQGNIFAGLAVSEYRDEFRRGDFLVRNILGGDPNAGVLAVGARPRVGQTMQFQLRDGDAADEDLRHACEEIQREAGQPFAGLMFSCTGRGARLFGVPNHDAGIFEETFGRAPLAGFFCNGEFGPVAGTNFIHGYTASAALFMNP
ncbi:MAG: FIST C-terminal domain-containing protein [Verrucomicrobiales bacterium]